MKKPCLFAGTKAGTDIPVCVGAKQTQKNAKWLNRAACNAQNLAQVFRPGPVKEGLCRVLSRNRQPARGHHGKKFARGKCRELGAARLTQPSTVGP